MARVFSKQQRTLLLLAIAVVTTTLVTIRSGGLEETLRLYHRLAKFFNGQCRSSRSECDALRFEDIRELPGDSDRVVQYVRCNHLVPPSTQAHNLTDTSKRSPSQLRREIWEIFRFKRNGFFVECGANDGEYWSNTLDLELRLNWTGLLIEAHPELGKQLLTKRRRAWFANVCVSPKNSVAEMELLQSHTGLRREDNWRNGISKVKMADDVDDRTGRHKHIYDFAPYGTVKCFPMFSLLSALKVKHVDFLSLDVQGIELKILKTLPFDQLRIDYVQAEHDLVPEGKKALRSFMESKGYRVIFEKPRDYIFEYVGEQRR